jgi:hypothetical protein
MSIHEDWAKPEASKQGMSPAIKVLLIVGGVGGFFLLLCCGGIGLFAWKFKGVIEEITVTKDADEIRRRTGKIIEIDIPPEFEPVVGHELFFMRWVGYEKIPRDGSRLVLLEVNNQVLENKTLAEQRRAMEEMLKSQGGQSDGFQMQINVDTRETRDVTVRGEPVEFEFNKGTSADGKPVRQVLGAFKTSGGVTLLNLIAPEESYDEVAVMKMIESIRAPVFDADDEAAGSEESTTGEVQPEKADDAGVKEGGAKENGAQPAEPQSN